LEPQCCGSGSGIRCLFDPWTGFFRIPDLGSRIPTQYFLELSDKFLGKKFYNSLKSGPNFFLQHLKNKIIFNFVKFVAIKKGLSKKNFSPFSFVAVFGSGIRVPGSGMGKNQDPESGINIRIRNTGPLNPDSDPVFLVNPSPDLYLGGCFIAISGSQLEDNFFEHSLEDLKVGARVL
jgi:hypothetical protein